MKATELEEHCEELTELIGQGPGRNDHGMRRVKALAYQFERASDHTYVREKLNHMVLDFEIWFSPRRWQKYGVGGERLRNHLYADVGKLEGAMRSFGGVKDDV